MGGAFATLKDGVESLLLAFSGPTTAMTLVRVDSRLREKILLCVSIVNNCAN